MKITIVYDNTVFKKGLIADWGFSCLVEVEKTPKILFDTGANGSILLDNMKGLGIKPMSIKEVFISHNHFDHIGGLSDFLKINPEVKVYLPFSCPELPGIKEVIKVSEPLRIRENIFSTGELQEIEQSLVVKTDKGLVVIVGCSHPGVENILQVASQFGKVYALIGGLHGFSQFELLKDMELICPTHCTQYKSKIKSLYPEKYIEGGVGKIIKI